MSKIPRIAARECIRVLSGVGFYVARQSGSHIIMKRYDPKATTIVPNHDELAVGTLRRIISDAGLTVDEFISLLRG